MPQQRDSSGRFTKGGGGGGGTSLGSAYGQVVIDSSGVQRGINSAVGALNGMTRTLGGVIAKVGTGLAVAGAAGVAALVGVGVSGVKMAAQLEAQMSNIQAVMQITSKEAAALEDHILDLGVDPQLKVSALEAAAAVEMLGHNGLTTGQILAGAARSTVLLQNATGSDYAQAASIATDVMALFNIQASNMETAVDGITSVVSNSKFTITDYQYALAQAGGTAAVSGVSFEDLNTVIAAIAPAFADGSSAGAGFKMMIQRIANPTGEMAQVMRELNLMTADGKNQFYDAAGEMKSMDEISRMLNTSLSGLTEQQRTQAMTVMFGARSINAASQLMKYGATVTMTAAEAMDIFGVSQAEANAMIAKGVTEFQLLQRAQEDTSAAAAAATRMNNLSGSIEIMNGVLETLRIKIGKVFKGDVKDAVDSFTGVLARNADRIVNFFAIVRAIAMGIVSTIKSFLGGLTGGFDKNFSGLNKQSGSWGRNIIISLARGMAAAAVAVMRVLQQIGQMISHWLKPGSPPKLLPDIDDWGTGAMDAWLSGFSSADFSIFDDLANTVEKHLRSIAPEDDEGLVPRILGARAEIAAIIDQIRETGQVGADAFARLQAVTGPLPQSILDYAAALFEVEAAQTAVNNAQKLFSAIQDGNADNLSEMQELADLYGSDLQSSVAAYTAALTKLRDAKTAVSKAQTELNDVESKYDEILGPLNAQLREMENQKKAAEDKQKLADLDEIIAQAAADGLVATEAIAEREELLLRMKIRETENERDAAVDAAKDKLDAAQETAKTAEQLAEEQRQAALALAQAEVDAANTSLEAAKERLAVSQALFDAQQKTNDLLREQMDLLSSLADSLGGLGDALADGLSGAESILGDLGDGLGGVGDSLGDGLEESFDSVGEDIASSIDDMVADIQAEFEPMITAGEGLGKTWGEVFGKIATRMQEVKDGIGTNLQPLRDWFDKNKGPMSEFADDTFGRLGTKLIELGDDILAFVNNQGEKILQWYRDNKPLIDEFSEKVGKLLTSFVEFSTDGKVALMDFWNVVEPLLDGVITILLQLATNTMNAFTGNWSSVWAGNKEIAKTALETIKKTFIAFLNWVTGWFGSSWAEVTATWNSNWEMLKEIVSTVWENIKTSVSTFFTELGLSVAGGFLNFIASWTAKWEELKAIPGTIWGGIQTDTNTKLDEIKAAALEKVRGWFASMGLDFDAMKLRWQLIFADIELIVLTILTRLGLWMDAKILLITTFIITKFEELKLWWETTWLAIYTVVSTWLAEMYLIIYNKFVEIETFIMEKVEAVKLFIEEKVTALQVWWDATWELIFTTVKIILAKLWLVVQEKMGEVKSAIQGKILDVLLFLNGKVETFKSIGRDLIDGMKDGVTSAAGRLIDSVTSAVQGAINKAKALLGIASPSKVFGDFGENSMMSFGDRFQGSAKKAANLVRGAMQTSIDKASQYAHMTTASQRPLALAGAGMASRQSAPATQGDSGSSETFNFYAPITINSSDVSDGESILSVLKKAKGRS